MGQSAGNYLYWAVCGRCDGYGVVGDPNRGWKFWRRVTCPEPARGGTVSLNPDRPMTRADAEATLFVFCVVVLGLLLATVSLGFRGC